MADALPNRSAAAAGILPERLIITGATGFIGSHVASLARAAGWSVVALGSADIDLTDPDSTNQLRALVRDGDTLVHSAAIAPTKSAGDLCTNVRMTEHLVEGLGGVALRQCLVVSSDAVYGSASGLLREDSATNADSLHGVMSLARELLCSSIRADVHTIVRPAPVYGVGDTHNSYGPNRMARDLLSTGGVSIFGAGANVRDHVSVHDVAAIIVGLVRGAIPGTWLAASGSSISFADLAELIVGSGSSGTVASVGSEPTPTTRWYDTTALTTILPSLILTDPQTGVPTMVRAMTQKQDPAGSSS